jgi:hypothetical protein
VGARIDTGAGQFAAISAITPIGMESSVIDLHDFDAIRRAIAEFSSAASNGGPLPQGQMMESRQLSWELRKYQDERPRLPPIQNGPNAAVSRAEIPHCSNP